MTTNPMMLCLQCGYNLRGVLTPETPSGACPECGRGFSLEEMEEVRASARDEMRDFWPRLIFLPIGMICIALPCVFVIAGLSAYFLNNAVGLLLSLVLLAIIVAIFSYFTASRFCTIARRAHHAQTLPMIYRRFSTCFMLTFIIEGLLFVVYAVIASVCVLS